MRTFIYRDLPADAGDFRLISRRCLNALKAMRETHRFIRGMVAWVGFPQIAVVYHRSPRAAGETKYPLRKMIKFAWTAAVSFSTMPLRLGLALGFVVASMGLGFGAFVLFGRLFHWFTPEPGWSSLVVLISLVGGAVLISNGILGEYVGRIFEEGKGRPLYIVSTVIHGEVDAESRPASSSAAEPRPQLTLFVRGDDARPPSQTLPVVSESAQ
jgi:dolichol-phosphate mannosyltransferase